MSEVKHHGARRIWIAWETQRRSITLSRKVGAELHILDLARYGIWRYPLSMMRTARLLFANRGGIVFVQNPSMILAALAAFCKPMLRYTLIVDRHTNFTQIEETRSTPVRRLLLWMSRFSIRRADLTIVTNSDIDERYVRGTGRGFVLPDPYPELTEVPKSAISTHNDLRVLFVSSWQTDEPIREVIEVCRRLGSKITVYISGRVKPAYASVIASRPENFIPTGFLTDDEYFRLMSTVDCVLAVSSWPGTLCCGAYE
nr:glycosyltransferase [Gemmatimonadota bacterium]